MKCFLQCHIVHFMLYPVCVVVKLCLPWPTLGWIFQHLLSSANVLSSYETIQHIIARNEFAIFCDCFATWKINNWNWTPAKYPIHCLRHFTMNIISTFNFQIIRLEECWKCFVIILLFCYVTASTINMLSTT